MVQIAPLIDGTVDTKKNHPNEHRPKMTFAKRAKSAFPWLQRRPTKPTTLFKEVFPLEDLPVVGEEEIPEVPNSRVGDYNLLEKLGEGGFGAVFLGRREAGDDEDLEEEVAIKAQLLKPDHPRMEAHLKIEYNILKRQGSSHPNIIGFHTSIRTSKALYMVMEKATVDLDTLICCQECQEPDSRYSRQQADFLQQVFKGILRAVSHLHELGIAHCDIKPSNVLIQSDALDPTNNYRLIPGRRIEANDIRLCDFGISQISEDYVVSEAVGGRDRRGWSKKQRVMRQISAGTREFGAPECSSKRPYEARRADIWAVGATMVNVLFFGAVHETCRGAYMYRDSRRTCMCSTEFDGHTGSFREAWTLYDLLFRKLLPYKPEHRISAKVALNHSWFKAAGPQ